MRETPVPRIMERRIALPLTSKPERIAGLKREIEMLKLKEADLAKRMGRSGTKVNWSKLVEDLTKKKARIEARWTISKRPNKDRQEISRINGLLANIHKLMKQSETIAAEKNRLLGELGELLYE